MSSRHLVRTADEASFAVPLGYEKQTNGYQRWTVVGEETGAVHTGFGIGVMEPGGSIAPHLHSFEESLFVLEGEVVLRRDEGAARMRAGDYGLISVGVVHSLRNESADPARWAALAAPQPRAATGGDTYFVPPLPEQQPVDVDVRDPRTRSFGRIEPANMAVDGQTQERLAVSASMRTALLVYSGITVKMMIDTELGAQLSTMFMVQYEPDGIAGHHDHPFEETYLILEGVVDAEFDGRPYRMATGDVAWAGVGCIHKFTNPGPGIVRWLETQAPQPPARHSYRFARDWQYLSDSLE